MAEETTEDTNVMSLFMPIGGDENTRFDRLKPPHRAFVRRYLRHFNASKAYRETINKDSKMPHRRGYELLHNQGVEAAIKEQMDKQGCTPERIKTWLLEIATGDLADYGDVSPTETLAQMREAGVPTRLLKRIKRTASEHGDTVDVEAYGRLEAIKILTKIMGMEKTVIETGPTLASKLIELANTRKRVEQEGRP